MCSHVSPVLRFDICQQSFIGRKYVDNDLCIFWYDDGVYLEALCQVEDEEEGGKNLQITHHHHLLFVSFCTLEGIFAFMVHYS